jgi:hypothetical protein
LAGVRLFGRHELGNAGGYRHCHGEPVTVSFASTTARYVQIRQLTNAGTTSWWSIYDLNLYGP